MRITSHCDTEYPDPAQLFEGLKQEVQYLAQNGPVICELVLLNPMTLTYNGELDGNQPSILRWLINRPVRLK